MSRRHALAAVTLTIAVGVAARAHAQTPPPRPAPTPAPAAPTGPAAPAPAAGTTPLPTVEVNDPLLAPIASPERMLTSFREALQIINARSTDLQIAEQEIERAQGLSRQALGQALPQITATGSITHNLIRGESTRTTLVNGTPTVVTVTSPATPTALAQLTVSMPLLAPRTWYAIGTARRNAEAAKISVDEARRQILVAVADAIVGVVTAERVAEVNRVGLRSALQRLELTRRMQRLGSGTMLDVVRAQQDATVARSTLITGDEALRRSREALGLTLGYPVQVGVPASISLNELEQSARSICSSGKPDQRADVRAAEAVLEVDERGVTDAKLAYAPTIVASTTATYSSELLVTAKHYAWSIQGVLTIPIWDGGSRYGAVRAAKAIRAEQQARVDATTRGATLDAAQAMRSVDVAVESAREAARARDLAAETARLSQVAFEAGTGTSFDLVESGRIARQAELDLAVKEFDVVRARLAALLATANCKY